MRQYGVRILVATSGRIGYFNIQALLVNLMVSLGLMSVTATIMEFVVLSLCPLRGLYKQLKERETVKISELRLAGRKRPKEYQALKE